MWDIQSLPKRDILFVDMKSFYASCMAALYNLDVDEVPIAVVGNFKQQGSVVLAASPAMKTRFNIRTGNRLFEIPKDSSIRLFEPQMTYFMNMSMSIIRLVANYVPKESIFIYSIDEFCCDLTGLEKMWGNPENLAKHIQHCIYQQFHIKSAAALAPNMLLAKLALDLEAKKTGFTKWTYDDVQTKLWPVKPLSKMWGIGPRMEKNLNALGINSVYDLAHYNVKDLEKRYGVMGSQMYYHAHGIDFSKVEAEPFNDAKGRVSFGKSQMLMRDYATKREVEAVLLEMCEDVMRSVRQANLVIRTIALGLTYSRHTPKAGFYRSMTLDEATNETLVVYCAVKKLLYEYFSEQPARQLAIRVSNLEKQNSVQLDFFDSGKVRRQQLGFTMDHIRERYGDTALLRAVSYTKAGTAIARNNLLGGHKR